MTAALHLSRVKLRPDAPIAALAPILVPDDSDRRLGAAHHLVWTLFADSPDRKRDFLWREEEDRRFLVLSRRRPEDRHALFEIDSKPFEPNLRTGDRLAFALRANPVVARKNAAGRSLRHDVVMDALRAMPPGTRSPERQRIAQEAGDRWFCRQGLRCGFEPDGATGVDGYRQVRVPRGQGRDVAFSMLDFTGHLVVTDPDAFAAALASGFGKARSFGCGLMLVRRA